MAGAGGELSIQASLHPVNGWLLVPLEVSDQITIEMVLDTGSPLSALSAPLLETLTAGGHVQRTGPNRYRLANVTVDRQPIGDLDVRPSRRVTQVGASGVLGLDFLARFTEIRFHIPTMRLVLLP